MFWRGLLGYLPTQAFKAVVGFGTVALFTRLLTPEQYGQYALAFPTAAIVQTLFLVWTEAAVERFHLVETEGEGARNHFTTVHRAYAALATAAVLFTAAALALLPLQPAFELALAAGVASGVARSGLKIIQKRRRAEGRVGVYAATDLVSTAAGFVIGGLCALAGWGAAAPFVGGFGAAAACLLLSGPGELRLGRGGRFEPARARRYAAYGFPVALSLLLGLVLASADRFLIGALLGESSVGVYHAGYAVARRTLDILFIWLGLAGGPAVIAALDRGGPGDFERAARTQAEVMILIGLPAAVGLGLVAQPLSALLIGPELREGAARVTPWIAASALLAGMTTYYLNQAFILARRSRLLIVSMAPPAAASVLLNLLLIPPFGLDGAMWAAVGSFAIGAATAYLLGRRVLPLPLPIAAGARAALAAAVMAAAVWVVPQSEPLPELLGKAAAGALAYGAVLALLELGVPSPGLAFLRRRLTGALRPRTRARRPDRPALTRP